MPQFELEEVGPERFSGLARGRELTDAVRRVLGGDDAAEIAAGEAGSQGWQDVRIDGAPAGRGRMHQRMRFRRD